MELINMILLLLVLLSLLVLLRRKPGVHVQTEIVEVEAQHPEEAQTGYDPEPLDADEVLQYVYNHIIRDGIVGDNAAHLAHFVAGQRAWRETLLDDGRVIGWYGDNPPEALWGILNALPSTPEDRFFLRPDNEVRFSRAVGD